MMVGEASCGKSSIIDGLKLAMGKLKNVPGYRNVEVFLILIINFKTVKLNPKSIRSH